jgi:hypothetical protein
LNCLLARPAVGNFQCLGQGTPDRLGFLGSEVLSLLARYERSRLASGRWSFRLWQVLGFGPNLGLERRLESRSLVVRLVAPE